MKILVVEDDPDYVNRILIPRLQKGGANTVVHAATHQDAVRTLEETHIDYVILDLAVPLDSVEGSPNVEHGQSLATYIRSHYSGTPILILTGQSSEAAFDLLEGDDSFANYWDGHRTDIVRKKKKSALDEALTLVKTASEQLDCIDKFEVDFEDEGSRSLSQVEKRAIRLFARCQDAAASKVASMKPGLSGSRVLRVELLNRQGHITQRAIAKIGIHEKIDQEQRNYSAFVNRLPLGACPARIDEYFVGCGKKKGVFYQLVDDVNGDFFAAIRQRDEYAAEVARQLRACLETWHNARESQEASVLEVRRTVCPDDKFEIASKRLEGIDLVSFERNTLHLNWSTQHGDLHGENVLVLQPSRPIVIDYGEIGRYPANFDAVSLALSIYFHPSVRDDFDADAQLGELWFDDERYLAQVQAKETASVLRRWSRDLDFTARQFYVVSYAYALKQLTYPGANEEFAAAIVAHAMERFLD